MLTVWDDLPIHQTPATLDQPDSSDPAVYERFYFGFFDIEGACMVGLVFNIHPNKGLTDAAFSVSRQGRHESLLVTDRLGTDRANLVCGPVRLVLLEPMKSLRITVDAAEGFGADITFTATTPAIEEPRVTRRRLNRVVQDRSRYVQLGSVSGRVVSPLGEVRLNEDTWRGGRDHSWGIWDAPKEHAFDTGDASPSFLWLIGSFDDWAFQAVTHEDSDGRVYGEYAATCPTLSHGAEPAGPGARQANFDHVKFDVRYPSGRWHLESGELVFADGGQFSECVHMRSLHAILPRSIGYDHPTWKFGTVYPRLPQVLRGSWNLAEEDLLQRHNHRAIHAVRITRRDGAVGYGLIDQRVSVAQAQRAGQVPRA